MSDNSLSPRKPLLAVVLSIMLPGLGQLYNGQLNKGIFLFLSFVFISLPFVAFIALILPPQWMLPTLIFSLVATLGIYLFAIFDAWKVARQQFDYRPCPWQQPAIYVVVILFAYLSVLGSSTQYVRKHLVEAFRIPSDSMTPNVLRGDYLFADKRVNCNGCKHQIKRGDVAIFVYPNNRTRLYIKRIIGLPGDEIRIEGQNVSVNGKSIVIASKGIPAEAAERKKYTHEQGDKGDYAVAWGEATDTGTLTVTVPAGEVFVLGDNRDASSDSRKFGTVPLMDVVGIARQVWFSSSPETGIRWSRLGKLIQ